MSNGTTDSLVPVPKVLLPALVLTIGILAHFIASGEFDRVEVAAAVTTAIYAVIGYAAPRE
jgi:hypothetical protein